MFNKIDEHKYVNIVSCTPCYYGTSYRVSIVHSYKIKRFGKLYDKKKVEELPFLFSSIEVAKDFCTIMPKIEKTTLYVRHGNNWMYDNWIYIKYKTYKLSIGDNHKCYIKWENEYTKKHSIGVAYSTIYSNSKTPIIKNFVEKFELSSFGDLDSPTFDNGCASEILSDYIKKYDEKVNFEKKIADNEINDGKERYIFELMPTSIKPTKKESKKEIVNEDSIKEQTNAILRDSLNNQRKEQYNNAKIFDSTGNEINAKFVGRSRISGDPLYIVNSVTNIKENTLTNELTNSKSKLKENLTNTTFNIEPPISC